jgi:hypothetical protein
LVSGTVKDLVAGSGLRFSDSGLHELEGAEQKWRLFTVGEIIRFFIVLVLFDYTQKSNSYTILFA